MYVLAPNQAVETFPYSIGALRRDNPNTSFPKNPPDELLAEWGVFPVEPVEPSLDPATQSANRLDPVFTDGKWVDTWDVYTVDQEEIAARIRANADYPAFWDALMASTVYAAIREQSFVSLPMNTLATEFIALIGDAKAGRPSEAAIQASMAAILSTGTFTEGHLAELQAALVAGRLQDIYTLS